MPAPRPDDRPDDRDDDRGDDRGETLLELIVAVGILGLCVLAIAGMIAVAVRVSDVHRGQSTAGVYLRSYAEAIDATTVTGYQNCAGTAAYASPSGFNVPSGYAASVVSVRYWNGTSFVATCSSDKGLQQLTLQVASSESDSTRRSSEQLVLVVRKP